MRKSKHTRFDRSLYSSVDETIDFHSTVCTVFEHLQSDSCQPAAFHKTLDKLARDGRLLHHITQNVDCIEHDYLPLMRRQYVFTAKSTSPDARNAIGPVSSSHNCSEAVIYQTVRTA